MSETVKRIKELTKSLAGDAKQLAKQAEAGFKSQWMSVDDRGEAEWGGTPGIYYGTLGLPALADLAKEGTAPEWAREADEKAGKIRAAVERKMSIEEPKGFPQHLARAAGEMAAQIPVPGAMMNKLRTAKLAVNEAPSLKRKIALSPLEYFSPIVEVGKPKPTAINYGVGTAFGGGLGYGIEKLTEDKPELSELISKYGPNYGSEARDVSKPKNFAKGGFAGKLKQGKSAFFSAVDNAIATLKQEKGTPEQMMSLIEKTPGVKKEELERRGIRKKLEGKKSVTRAELEAIAKERPAQAPNITRLKPKPVLGDFLERVKEETGLDDLALQNIQTKLGVVFYVDKHATTPRLRASADYDPNERYDLNELVDIATHSKNEGHITSAEYKDLLKDLNKMSLATEKRLSSKYDQYSLIGRGGERKDYQEVIMSMPTRMQQLREFADQRGITNIEEAEKAWIEEHGQALPEDENVGHWKDIPVPNYTVHYRTQSFIDKDGKKVLHVEEVQSDPHQRARDARKDEVKKRVENEKDKRFRALARQLDDDPDFLPEDYDFFSINESGEIGGEIGLGLFNSRTGQDLGSVYFDLGMTEDEATEQLKKKFKSKLRDALKKQVDLSDDEIKAIAKEVPEDFGYKTAEKAAKVKEINNRLRQITENGLSVDDIEEYFQPGKIINSWSGTDKVIDFQRGPKPLSPAWLEAYDDGLAYVRQNYPNNSDADLHTMATNIANGKAGQWHVKVVEIDPATGKEIGAPRIHSTSPLEQVRNDLRREIADIGGVISDLPYKKTYDELALKQIIDDAVNQGYDRVSISPGLFQVDRYESAIRSKIDAIGWGSMTDDGRIVSFIKNGSPISDIVVDDKGRVTSGPNEWKGEPLKNIIGEDMASKIIASPESGQFAGEGLTIGAKGFTEFYDKRLPNFLKEYLRKEFGTEPGRTEFEYGFGDKQKSRYAIEQDFRDRLDRSELTTHEINSLEDYTIETWADAYNMRARANGLDPEDPNVELSAWNEEGPFKGLQDQAQNLAINRYVAYAYNTQPEIRPKADVFSFDVTPEMAEKVKTRGQRLFAAAPIAALPMMEDESKAEETTAPSNEHSDWFSRLEHSISNATGSSGLKSPGARYAESVREPLTSKGKGYFGVLPTSSGQTATEISSTDEQGRHYPLLVPTLRNEEIQHLLQGNQPTNDIYDKAELWAESRRNKGLDPFAAPNELRAPIDVLTDRYGFAGGGRASKMKQVLKKMGVDESKVADKDLVTLQDFHTSLGDSIRERAAKMQQQMDAMEFKYEPGQHVFTESSARKNLPPLKILRRTMVGNQPVREPHPVHPLMGKVVKDPETGKTLRTPYEPGYKVRHERGEDDWAEYDIPESAIKGAVDFAKGGLAKKISELRARIKNEEGEYAAKRLDRAADEVRNLETTFNERALREAFMGDNTKGLAVINPADYEKYAASIPKHGYDETHAGPVYRIGDKAVTYDEYIKYLQNIANTTGLRNVPLLGVDKNKENLLVVPIHEGRHRQRALSGLGDTKALIQVLTGPSIREPLPRRTKEEGIEAVKSVISKKPAISEDALRNYKPGQVLTSDEIVILPEIFKHGGRV